MNTNTTSGNWNEIKDKIKSKWSKFSDNEIETFKDNLEQLSTKIQTTYGYAKERADREFKDFKETLSHLRAAEAKPPEPVTVKPIHS